MKLAERLLRRIPRNDFFRVRIKLFRRFWKLKRWDKEAEQRYTDFTFKFLSKLSNQLIRFLLDIRYGKEMLFMHVKRTILRRN